MKIFHKGFNYSQDGQGNRLVLHLQGCNMRCPWCANPEGISMNGTLVIHDKPLIDALCPKGAIVDGKLNRSICATCTTHDCVTETPNTLMHMSCKDYTIDELVDLAAQSKPMFFDGGGVTVSGGEPTLQFEELKELLKRLQEVGINTAIETNATNKRLPELIPLIDFFIIDLKNANSEQLKKITGVSAEIIKENIRYIAKNHKNVLIRTPLVHNFNDSEENLKEFIDFCKTIDSLDVKFEFLQFHEFSLSKWRQSGMEYKMVDGHLPKGKIEEFEKAFKDNNLKTIRT